MSVHATQIDPNDSNDPRNLLNAQSPFYDPDEAIRLGLIPGTQQNPSVGATRPGWQQSASRPSRPPTSSAAPPQSSVPYTMAAPSMSAATMTAPRSKSNGWDLWSMVGILLVIVMGGGIYLLYYSLNFSILGFDSIFHSDLYHTKYAVDLPWEGYRLGVQHLLALMISAAEIRLMPYEIKWKKVRGRSFPKLQRKLGHETWKTVIWWLVVLFGVGTNYYGMQAWIDNGVTLPTPFIQITLATTGLLGMIETFILAAFSELAPEPMIRLAYREIRKETGW